MTMEPSTPHPVLTDVELSEPPADFPPEAWRELSPASRREVWAWLSEARRHDLTALHQLMLITGKGVNHPTGRTVGTNWIILASLLRETGQDPSWAHVCQQFYLCKGLFQAQKLALTSALQARGKIHTYLLKYRQK